MATSARRFAAGVAVLEALLAFALLVSGCESTRERATDVGVGDAETADTEMGDTEMGDARADSALDDGSPGDADIGDSVGDRDSAASDSSSLDSQVSEDVLDADLADATELADTVPRADVNDAAGVDVSLDAGADGALASRCATLCAARDNDERGFCTQEGYFGVSACVAYCEAQAGGWGEDIWAAFTPCVDDNPLCFETISQCVMRSFYADAIEAETPLAQRAEVVGSRFGDFEGRWAFLIINRDFGDAEFSDQTRVRSGAFESTWDFTESLGYNTTMRASLYVDADENLSCEAEADAVFGGELLPIFGTDPLVFRWELAPASAFESFMAERICEDSF